jgi:hypothetical protein
MRVFSAVILSLCLLACIVRFFLQQGLRYSKVCDKRWIDRGQVGVKIHSALKPFTGFISAAFIL